MSPTSTCRTGQTCGRRGCLPRRLYANPGLAHSTCWRLVRPGLPGIAALAMGFGSVQRIRRLGLTFAADNAVEWLPAVRDAANGLAYPPENARWPIILAADLIYEMRNVAPIVALIQQLLSPDGLCLLTDQDARPPCPAGHTRPPRACHSRPRSCARQPGGRHIEGDPVSYSSQLGSGQWSVVSGQLQGQPPAAK